MWIIVVIFILNKILLILIVKFFKNVIWFLINIIVGNMKINLFVIDFLLFDIFWIKFLLRIFFEWVNVLIKVEFIIVFGIFVVIVRLVFILE